jgi:hypothetical protein
MPCDRWIEELRADRINQALADLRLDLESPSNFYSLGAVYMWTGDYESALVHFDEQIQAALPRNPAADVSFGMAGAAAWCLEDEKSAVRYWQEGTTAAYAVGGANTRTALLLYVASVLKPDTFSAVAAHNLLRKKANHRRVESWPGRQQIQLLRKRAAKLGMQLVPTPSA